MDFDQLEIFLEVARLSSFSRAAEKRFRTQPAISSQIRALEEGTGVLPHAGVKIIMTTAVDDIKEVIRCFQELCDSYLTKPVDLSELLTQMKSHGLIQ